MTRDELEQELAERANDYWYEEGNEVIDDILTLEEAAGLLGVHPKTITRWLKSGDIDGCSFRGKRRVYILKSECQRVQARGVRGPGRPRKE